MKCLRHWRFNRVKTASSCSHFPMVGCIDAVGAEIPVFDFYDDSTISFTKDNDIRSISIKKWIKKYFKITWNISTVS